MFRKIKAGVPLFQQRTPWLVQVATVLYVGVWFRELIVLGMPLVLFSIGVHAVSKQQEIGATMLFFLLGSWLALNAALTIGLAYRKNWARIVQLILTLFCTALSALLVIAGMRYSVGFIYLANAVATVLLFTPSASRWFNPADPKAGSAATT